MTLPYAISVSGAANCAVTTAAVGRVGVADGDAAASAAELTVAVAVTAGVGEALEPHAERLKPAATMTTDFLGMMLSSFATVARCRLREFRKPVSVGRAS